MASLQDNKSNSNLQYDDHTNLIYTLDITNGSFPEKMPDRVENGDMIEFKTNKTDEYDIFQVYKDGNDYYRVTNGLELLNIRNDTPEKSTRILFSFALNQPEVELYFCIIPSSQRATFSKTRQCPKENCERNCVKLNKAETTFSLNDNKESQKIYFHKGDTIELDWTSKRGTGYRIEEKKYCPISGGLYTVEQSSETTSTRAVSSGKFTKTFNEFGMSFLFRLTDTNQIHDITVCIVKERYKIKHIEVTDTIIEPNIIWIEQNDSIVFEWNTQRKQTIAQIEPFILDEKQQCIEVCTSRQMNKDEKFIVFLC